jgi:hypothetical protein
MTTSLDIKQDEPREVKIKMVTLNNLIILGKLTVPVLANSYRSRLSDILNQSHNFIALTDVEVYQNTRLLTKTSFLCVNKETIVLLTEEKEEIGDFSNLFISGNES